MFGRSGIGFAHSFFVGGSASSNSIKGASNVEGDDGSSEDAPEGPPKAKKQRAESQEGKSHSPNKVIELDDSSDELAHDPKKAIRGIKRKRKSNLNTALTEFYEKVNDSMTPLRLGLMFEFASDMIVSRAVYLIFDLIFDFNLSRSLHVPPTIRL